MLGRGFDDRTASIVQKIQDPRVRLFEYKENEGKTRTLNKTVPEITNEIIVFTDASEMLAADSIREHYIKRPGPMA